MATHHAVSGEVVDLATWSNELGVEKSKVIAKSKGIELARLVIDAGVDMHHSEYCSVNGASVFHCIQGHVTLRTPEKKIPIKQGRRIFKIQL